VQNAKETAYRGSVAMIIETAHAQVTSYYPSAILLKKFPSIKENKVVEYCHNLAKFQANF
jgi:hypothetical protein